MASPVSSGPLGGVGSFEERVAESHASQACAPTALVESAYPTDAD
jgi:hypothetical protein